jgi:predicted adenine nucleotide alpha hydrolase (AANH) superfamily ATPase
MSEKPPLLLHICCGPCGGGCIERLLAENRRFRLYYSNSNLVDAQEFEKRLASVEVLAKHYDIPLEVDPYRHEAWQEAVQGFEREPEGGRRCQRCFYFNLMRTAQAAARCGENFATTLTVSPRKKSSLIFEAGKLIDARHFEEWDFKKQNGYTASCRIARELELYRQDFCGCTRRFDDKVTEDLTEQSPF